MPYPRAPWAQHRGGKDGLLFPAADGVGHLATSTL